MWRNILDKYRTPAWLLAVALLAYGIWRTYYDLLAIASLALLASLAFIGSALLAGRPYLWRKPSTCPAKRGRRGGFLSVVGVLAAVVQLAAAFAAPRAAAYLTKELDDNVEAAIAYSPIVSTRVFSADGELICNLTLQDRVLVTLDRVPIHVRQAFIAAEDKDFYSHHGVDLTAIIRAAIANHRSGHHKQGGSTLTQQVVKQVILKTNEKTYLRKIREVLLAVRLEKQVTKDRILEIYLNQIFLGHGAYGIEAAAQAYFGKDVAQLTLAEAAILAGLPKAPTTFSPYGKNFPAAKSRQAYVLGRMADSGYITEEQRQAALAEEIIMIDREDPLNRTAAPYFCEHVRKELTRMYGEKAIYAQGLTVYTTLDMRMQRAAEAAVRFGLIDIERRLGFNGPEGHDQGFTGECRPTSGQVPDNTIEMARAAEVKNGITVCARGSLFPMDPNDVKRIRDWEWRAGQKLAVGDLMSIRVETRQERAGKQTKAVRYAISSRRTAGPGHPEALQAAIVVVDPRTGALKALVGGYDYSENQYNAATMAHRQPGSSIKPYVYLTALMRGITVDDTMTDTSVCYPTASGIWCPTNYNNQYYGTVDLRTALARSLNSISVQLTAKVGVDEVIKTMRRLGVVSPLERVLPLSVGAADITLWEHTYAYAAIAAGGKQLPRHPDAAVAGYFFTKILDENGREIYAADDTPMAERPQAVPADDAYALTYLMKGVVEQGTGRRVRELARPAAGKTGTTNDFRDVWFMGFTPDLVAGVWVGRMTPQPIAKDATGGGIALPIWLAFMKAAHPDTPPRDFPVPPDISLMRNEAGEVIPYQRGRVPKRLLPYDPPKLESDSGF